MSGVKSVVQLLIFLGILAGYYYIAWPLLTKEALAAGAVLGLLVHWAITNKGNRDIWNMHPLGGGFRVLFYDMLFAALLTALVQQGLVSELFSGGQVSALATALLGAILIDYSITG